jgi:transporter family-2 protein
VLSGVTSALQAAVNGALAVAVGSAPLAALTSFGTGALILVGVTVVSPRIRPRVLGLVRSVRLGELRWWMLLGGVAGAVQVFAQASTVGLTGVAAFTVALVAGQMVSGVVVDMIGLHGVLRRAPSRPRLLGACLGIAAFALAGAAAADGTAPAHALLLTLPFCAGLLRGWQQTANARVRAVGGSAILAATVNFLAGTATLALVCSVVLAIGGWRLPTLTEPVPWWLLTGGALGIVLVTISTIAVPRIGVLLFGLLTVVGQLGCALALALVTGPPAWPLIVAVLLGTAAAVVAAWPPSARR